MKRCHGCTILVAAILTATACGDDATAPTAEGCTAETSTVTASVSTGQSIVFDWEPRCTVAMLLIEEDASDMWGILTDEDTWDSPTQANLITPPVTYGVAPAGIESLQAARLPARRASKTSVCSPCIRSPDERAGGGR